MRNRRLLSVNAWGALTLLGLLASSVEAAQFISSGVSSPKTLFHWTIADPPEEEPDEVDRLVTDRPHFSEASSLVGLGVSQLETGYTLFQDRAGGVLTQTHSFGEPLLRVGMFAEWFEFRLGYTYLGELTDAPGSRTWHDGSDDLYLGAKLAFTEQAGWLPEVALFPQMRVPTGSSTFTSGEVLPGFNLAYSWVITDWLELEMNTQLNRRLDSIPHYYSEFIQTLNFEYELAQRLGAFTELIAFVPSGAIVNQNEYYFHAGFVYFVGNNIQLDIHSGVGLNAAAVNLAFTGVGFSARW